MHERVYLLIAHRARPFLAPLLALNAIYVSGCRVQEVGISLKEFMRTEKQIVETNFNKCRRIPTVSLISPTSTIESGTSANYILTIINNDEAPCPPTQFRVQFNWSPPAIGTKVVSDQLDQNQVTKSSLAPKETISLTFRLQPPSGMNQSPLPSFLTVTNGASSLTASTAIGMNLPAIVTPTPTCSFGDVMFSSNANPTSPVVGRETEFAVTLLNGDQGTCDDKPVSLQFSVPAGISFTPPDDITQSDNLFSTTVPGSGKTIRFKITPQAGYANITEPKQIAIQAAFQASAVAGYAHIEIPFTPVELTTTGSCNSPPRLVLEYPISQSLTLGSSKKTTDYYVFTMYNMDSPAYCTQTRQLPFSITPPPGVSLSSFTNFSSQGSQSYLSREIAPGGNKVLKFKASIGSTISAANDYSIQISALNTISPTLSIAESPCGKTAPTLGFLSIDPATIAPGGSTTLRYLLSNGDPAFCTTRRTFTVSIVPDVSNSISPALASSSFSLAGQETDVITFDLKAPSTLESGTYTAQIRVKEGTSTAPVMIGSASVSVAAANTPTPSTPPVNGCDVAPVLPPTSNTNPTSDGFYHFTLTNPSSVSCEYQYGLKGLPAGTRMNVDGTDLFVAGASLGQVAAGASKSFSFKITSQNGTPGTYPITIQAFPVAFSGRTTSLSFNFVICPRKDATFSVSLPTEGKACNDTSPFLTVGFRLRITNNDDSSCSSSTFSINPSTNNTSAQVTFSNDARSASTSVSPGTPVEVPFRVNLTGFSGTTFRATFTITRDGGTGTYTKDIPVGICYPAQGGSGGYYY